MPYGINLGEDWQALLFEDGRVLLQHVSQVIHKSTGSILDLTKIPQADQAQIKVVEKEGEHLAMRTLEVHPDGSVWVDPNGAMSRWEGLSEDAFCLLESTTGSGAKLMQNKRLKEGA